MQDTGKTEMSFLESALDGSKIKIQYFGDLDQSIFKMEQMMNAYGNRRTLY